MMNVDGIRIVLRAARRRFLGALAVTGVLAAGLALAPDVHAQDYFKGKTVHLQIGAPQGGGYWLIGRLVADHLPRFLPGQPTIITEVKPGGGSLIMSNYIYAQAPADGTVIGIGNGSLSSAGLFGFPGARFDSRRFSWIGSVGANVTVTVAWSGTPVQTTEDLFTKDFVIGGSGAATDISKFPTVLNTILGTRFKIIKGYTGATDIALAMERGEVQGIGSWAYDFLKASKPDWIRDKKIKLLLQIGLAPHPELPDVPTVMEVAKTDEQRALLRLVFTQLTIGRPIIGPPNMPANVLAMHQKAFNEMVVDAKFKADAESRNLEVVNPVSGPDALKLVESLYASDPVLVKKAATALEIEN
jgi:tripartite-type tricarboxylate transporter receptor subunit TctC